MKSWFQSLAPLIFLALIIATALLIEDFKWHQCRKYHPFLYCLVK